VSFSGVVCTNFLTRLHSRFGACLTRSCLLSWGDELTRARNTQKDPAWRAEYRATRPKVERKIGHLLRRKHGGRRARVRGGDKVAADFSLLAAAVNLTRLGALKIAGIARPEWAGATA
jgi:Transposase DDE domain